MSLRLYNTLTRRKEAFAPIDPAAVRVYVCGPTVYDFAHIGNARPVIVFDVLFRLLRQVYGAEHVIYARNVTDVDDKINARAARDYPDLPFNEAIARVTETTARQFHEDVAALGCLPPTVEPRATDHIAPMRAMIERLVARGVAYVAEDHVLFSPAAMDALPGAPRYGSLARRSLDEMLAGARVDVAPYKRDPMDFVLVEAVEAGRAELAEPGRDRRAGPPRLAHRVLGHVDGEAAGAVRRRAPVRRSGAERLRHPRRRDRPRLPPPRERDRPVLLRLRRASAWPTSGCTTAFCRSKARRCRRASATSSPSANCCATDDVRRPRLAGRGPAPCDAAHPLSPADRLDGQGARGSRGDARPLV